MRSTFSVSRLSWLVGLLALFLLVTLPGCDTAGSETSETIVLSDPVNPTEASFEFAYGESDFADGAVTVTSDEQDQLSDVLEAYGYTRSDVVSVQVEEVKLERLSIGGTATKMSPGKVFNYISRAEVYMGPSEEAPLIGERQPVPSSNAVITLDLGPDQDVTSQVTAGPTRALLQLFLNDPELIGGGGDRVKVDVAFRIEVQQP